MLKDFTTVLEKPYEERQAILAQLRAIYDGLVKEGVTHSRRQRRGVAMTVVSFGPERPIPTPADSRAQG